MLNIKEIKVLKKLEKNKLKKLIKKFAISIKNLINSFLFPIAPKTLLENMFLHKIKQISRKKSPLITEHSTQLPQKT